MELCFQQSSWVVWWFGSGQIRGALRTGTYTTALHYCPTLLPWLSCFVDQALLKTSIELTKPPFRGPLRDTPLSWSSCFIDQLNNLIIDTKPTNTTPPWTFQWAGKIAFTEGKLENLRLARLKERKLFSFFTYSLCKLGISCQHLKSVDFLYNFNIFVDDVRILLSVKWIPLCNLIDEAKEKSSTFSEILVRKWSKCS